MSKGQDRHNKWASAADKASAAAALEPNEEKKYQAAQETMEEELKVATPEELRTMVFILTFGGMRPPEDFEKRGE